MAILPSGWSWLSFVVGALFVQFVLPFLLGLVHRGSATAKVSAGTK